MLTHGNGNMLSRTLHELRGDRFNDIEESFYYGCITTGRKLCKPLPVFDKWIGKYGPSGAEIRELYGQAANSILTSTGMSDKKRHEREIQRVGTIKSTSTDITHRTLSNYVKLSGVAGGVATMGIDTGEIATAVIDPSQKASYFSHTYEQAAGRPNNHESSFLNILLSAN